jgi:hypothetical protein
MPLVFRNGTGVTSAEISAYHGASQQKAAGVISAAGQGITQEVEDKVDEISNSWTDSGGTGHVQKDVAPEVLARAAAVQGQLASTVRQWAKPGRERALLEMFGVLTQALGERDRLLLELRERLNASPY